MTQRSADVVSGDIPDAEIEEHRLDEAWWGPVCYCEDGTPGHPHIHCPWGGFHIHQLDRAERGTGL